MPAVKMCVVDTSAWIEWLIGSLLKAQLTSLMPNQANCIVPTIVQLELAKWLMREKGEAEADLMIAYTQKCVVSPLDTTIALSAANLHQQYKLATADAIVYATALHLQADLLTCDAHFKDLPHVIYLAK